MRVLRIVLVCVLLACSGALGQMAAKSGGDVVLLSDIHLDPLPPAQQCATAEGKAVVAKLLAGKPSQWTADDFRLQPPTAPGVDSKYALMASALKAARAAAPSAKLVLVPGDLLEHSFRDQLHACAPAATDEQVTQLAANTVEFVTRQIGVAFPMAQVIPVLGNNDSDSGDYQLPSASFLAAVGAAWQTTVTHGDRHVHADFAAFARGGYFSVTLAAWPHVRVIALNSVLWSAKFSAAGAGRDAAAGDDELQWLQEQLTTADRAGEKVVLLGHIPPGLDAYATRMAHGSKIVSFYRDCGEAGAGAGCRDYAHAVPAMMQRFHASILMGVFGHTHQNEFRIVGQGTAAIPLKVVPSISPIFQNNPAFLLAHANAAFAWTDYQSWDLELSAGKTDWTREFDFDTEYAQRAWDAAALQKIMAKLRDDTALRQRFFLEMSSGNAQVSVPAKWQDAYLCGLAHMTPETVLACVAGSQLDIPLP
jgi:sphingomyelin phosphodiesterase acid-like 3